MSFTQQFESVWEGMDQSYMFWERDTVDWEARYDECKSIFKRFDSRPNSVTKEEYQQAWDKVFEGLLDHHLFARLWNPKGNYHVSVSPGKNDYSHWTDIYAQLVALANQPGITNFVGTNPTEKNPGMWFCLLPGKSAGKYIAYFRFTNFSFGTMHDYEERGKLPNASQTLAPVHAFYGSRYYEGMQSGDQCWANNDMVESLILDVRGNGGGELRDLSPLIGSLLNGDSQVGYTRVKNGFGRLDYSGWVPFVIPRPEMHLSTEKPIVILSDINSASCSEITTLLIKSQPNGTFIGERTHGATCALWPNSNVSHDLFYNGCFGDYGLYEDGYPNKPNTYAYYVYTSNVDMVTSDYKSLEGVGVQPDIEVLYDADKLYQGVDTQLEKALEFLRSKN